MHLSSVILLFTVISYSNQERRFTKVLSTANGPVRGEGVSTPENKTVYQYLGIPYAKAHRFEYPQEYIWTEIFNANQYGEACPQTSSPFGVQRIEKTSEQCLNLNIFAPESQENNLAVLVYFGGLFYSFGKANGTNFDSVAVASRGNVVVVSLNHRLGIFGFLSRGSGDLKGNYGLADQIEALKWLQRNVQRFGGNPDDVTVVGHWSGAMSVGLLLVSPKARGLFKHVVLMSGSPLSLTATLDHVTAAERARNISEHLKCASHSSVKACLKTKSVGDLILAQEQVQSVPILSPFAPVIDGDILKDSPEVLFKTSKQINAESVMIGMVEDDGAIFLSPSLPGVTNNMGSLNQGINRSTLYKIIQNNKLSKLSAATSVIKYEYTNWDNPEDEIVNKHRLIDIYSDASFGAPALRLANLLSRKGIPTFVYRIQKNAFNTTMLPRIPIGRGDDLRLMFDSTFTNVGMRGGRAGGIMGQAFGMLMEFVKTGKPSPQKWPTYGPEGKFISIGQSNITVQSKLLPDRIAFWNELLPSMTSQSFTNTAQPTVSTTTSNHGSGIECFPKKDKSSKALTAVVSVMAIVIIIMLSIITYQTRMLSKRGQDPAPSQQEH